MAPRTETLELPSEAIAARLAREDLAASFEDSDRNPPVFDPASHSVTMPESFKKSYAAYMDGGWGLLLVEQASDRWGVADGSMRVWFEIDR